MARDIYSGRRIRERIPAKLRKQALEKAKNTCQYPKCKISSKYVMLQAHHINLKNDNNRFSNIKMLCPTHHSRVHNKLSKKYEMEQKRKKKKEEKGLLKYKKELKLLEKKREKLRKANVLKRKKESKLLQKRRGKESLRYKKELKLLEKKREKLRKANVLKRKKAKKR